MIVRTWIIITKPAEEPTDPPLVYGYDRGMRDNYIDDGLSAAIVAMKVFTGFPEDFPWPDPWHCRVGEPAPSQVSNLIHVTAEELGLQ